MEDLEADVGRWTTQDEEKNRRDGFGTGAVRKIKLRRIDLKKGACMPTRLEVTPRQGSLVVMLGRRIAQLCRVSLLVRLDMAYVGQLWQRDLERYVESQLPVVQLRGSSSSSSLPVVAAGYQWLVNAEAKQRVRNGEKGVEIMAGARSGGWKRRRQKCWYCTERHRDGDPVCPLERREPERWERITRKVGGRRGGIGEGRVFDGKKIVFYD